MFQKTKQNDTYKLSGPFGIPMILVDTLKIPWKQAKKYLPAIFKRGKNLEKSVETVVRGTTSGSRGRDPDVVPVPVKLTDVSGTSSVLPQYTVN